MYTRSKYCIIGIPDHQGIIHVGGRVGASRGPSAFRKIFDKMKANFKFRDRLPEYIQDLGNLDGMTSDVAQNHSHASAFIQKAHQVSGISIVIGGGHDHGYSQLKGVYNAFSQIKEFRLGCINIDAHLDVRKPEPLISSGSPFYLALESGILDPKRFIEFGVQSQSNSIDLWNYVQQKNIDVIPWESLRHDQATQIFKKKLQKLARACDGIVVSLDLDSIASAFCPGVSAPQAEGFTSREIIEMMEIAGSEKKVKSLGIFELNPEHDQDDRSSRLAATAVFHFINSSVLFLNS